MDHLSPRLEHTELRSPPPEPSTGGRNNSPKGSTRVVTGSTNVKFRVYADDDQTKFSEEDGRIGIHDLVLSIEKNVDLEFLTAIQYVGCYSRPDDDNYSASHLVCSGTAELISPITKPLVLFDSICNINCILHFKPYLPIVVSTDANTVTATSGDISSFTIDEIALGHLRQNSSKIPELVPTYKYPEPGNSKPSANNEPPMLKFRWGRNDIDFEFSHHSGRVLATTKSRSVLKTNYMFTSDTTNDCLTLIIAFILRYAPKFYALGSGSIRSARDINGAVYASNHKSKETKAYNIYNGATISWKNSHCRTRLYRSDYPTYRFLDYATVIVVRKRYKQNRQQSIENLVHIIETIFLATKVTTQELSPHLPNPTNSLDIKVNYGSLSYRLIYQLEVLFSNNIFPKSAWNAICTAFLEYAVTLYDEDIILKCLEDEYDNDKRYTTVYDELERIVDIIEENRLHIAEMARKRYHSTPGCMFIRRVYVTPSHIYCLHPCAEVTNRILRTYKEYSDYFIRVTFVDEDMLKLALPPGYSNIDSINNVSRCPSGLISAYTAMSSGIHIANRIFSMLSFSSSQLRDHSSWFFSGQPDGSITTSLIRSKAGVLPGDSVAIYTARLGQCFSTTIRTVKLNLSQITTIPDITRNNYIFSDGVGIISYPLAVKVVKKLGISHMDITPSCLQFRFSGYKGVLSTEKRYIKDDEGKYIVDKNQGEYVIFRSSQLKFISDNMDLEIVAYSQRSPCFLNRQIISILLGNGVTEKDILQIALNSVETMRKVFSTRYNLVNFIRRVLEPSAFFTNVVTHMADSSMYSKRERSLLEFVELIIRSRIQESKCRARILIEDGAQALGILDNYEILNSDEVFFQRSSDNSPGEIIEGDVIVTRSPCFYLGDVRLLKAVNPKRPELEQFTDVVVFSSKGQQPVPNMMSGGDLDGDNYFICWDKALTSNFTNTTPEPFNDDKNKKVGRKYKDYSNAPTINEDKLAAFFLDYIINDNLGVIANTHAVVVDIVVNCHLNGTYPYRKLNTEMAYRSALNVDIVRELAMSHSIAVDFPKKAESAIFNRRAVFKELGLEMYNNLYPEFCEKSHKPTYISRSTIAKLYDYFKNCDLNIEDTARTNSKPQGIYYLLECPIEVSSEYIEDAVKTANAYHIDMIHLANKYSFSSEAETFSAIISHVKSDFFRGKVRKANFEPSVKNYISCDVYRVINYYRETFWEKVFSAHYPQGGYSKDSNEYKAVVKRYPRNGKKYKDMYEIALAWYKVAYDPQYTPGILRGHPDFKEPSVLTFPLVIYDVILDLYEFTVGSENGSATK